jgi:general secretion pathway protein L
MSPTLIFRWLAPDRVAWSTAGAVPRQGTPAELAAQAGGNPLLLIAPGTAVILTQATVPGRNRATRLKAIPYALEENLAEDVEALHFAVGEVSETPVPVAVVRQGTLTGWLDTCTQAGLTPHAVIPEPLLLPYEENAWSLLLDEAQAVVRSGRWDGFTTDRSELILLLRKALAEAGEQAPQTLRLWGEFLPELADLGIEICREDGPAEPLAVFATGYDPATTINLLQGPYSRQAQLGRWLRPWRVAAVLAGVWLTLQLVAQLGEYWQLKQEQQRLLAAMEQLYKDTVPDARKIINPRVQMESRLRELHAGETGAGTAFLELLYQGGQPLQAVSGVTLRSLRYKENQLDFDLESGSLEVFDQLKQRFGEQTGLDAQIRTTKREGKVESQITLKKAAS